MKNSFGIPIIPPNEKKRLAALQSLHIMDSEPELFFDNIAQIMAQCFQTPIALISLVDKEQVLFKANVGMTDTRNVSRGVSLCSLAILQPLPTIFEDALKEPCLLANPLVAGKFGMRFYAGAPIITPDGYAIGTACVIDKKARSFSEVDTELLAGFAKSAMKGMLKRRLSLEKVQS